MAYIEWSVFAAQNFTPEQLDCASRGGTWDRVAQSCTFAQPLPPSEPLLPPSSIQSSGSVDPDQMFADGFVYVSGRWVRWDSPEARGAGQAAQPSGGARPGSVSVLAVIPSGSVLGYDVPAAAPVALPSFVGGLMGTVRLGGGMRPSSGGTPKRVVMGPGNGSGGTLLPQVRMGAVNWGR